MSGGLEPGHDGPPIHRHKHMSESFEVQSGTLDIFIDGEWREFPAGSTYTVPVGGSHAARNHHDEPAHIVHIHSPAGKMEEFFTVFCALVRAGRIKSVPPKDPRSLFLLTNLFASYREDIEFLKPPPPVYMVIATVGKMLGYRLPDPRPTTADALLEEGGR